MNAMLSRIERQAGVPGLASILTERLTPTDLQSLLLEVYRRRTGLMEPTQVFKAYQSDRFVRPAQVSPDDINRWERVVYDSLDADVTPLALSSVCPLGSCSVVAGIEQNWVVSTARNSEVVSDPTNVLALECASRRGARLREDPKSRQAVHLAASMRVLRAQRFEGPNLFSHFHLFCMVSGGRDRGGREFEIETILRHVRTYLRILRIYLGDDMRLAFSMTAFSAEIEAEFLENQLLAPVRSEFENLTCWIDAQRTSGRGYYRSMAFHIDAHTRDGQTLQLADGGDTDWTQQYLSNAKERLVTSALAGERVCMLLDQ